MPPAAEVASFALGTSVVLAAGFAALRAVGRLRIPHAITLMAVGVAVGPSALDWLPDAYLEQRSLVTKAAFVVILMRAGLGVPVAALRTLIVPTLVLGVVPVLAEVGVLAGLIRGLVIVDSWRIALLAAFLIAAVSPAVVIPAILDQKDAGLGARTGLADRILAITIANVTIAQMGILVMIETTRYWGPVASYVHYLWLFPLSIAGGAAAGWLLGRLTPLDAVFGPSDSSSAGPRTQVASAMVIAVGALAYFGGPQIGLEGAVAALAAALTLRARFERHEPALHRELGRAWSLAEILLFGTLGSQIQLEALSRGGIVATVCAVIAFALGVRLLVTALLTGRSALPSLERRHLIVAQFPKATVQAVFGGLPLMIYEASGRTGVYKDGGIILMMSVAAIVLTAPLGAWLIARSGERVLEEGQDSS